MKPFLKYRHLSALLAVIVIAFALAALTAQPMLAVFIIGSWQLSQFAMSKRAGFCYLKTLTDDQVREFEDIMKSFGEYATDIKNMPGRFRKLETENDELRGELKKMKKILLSGKTGGELIQWRHGQPIIPTDAAEALCADFLLQVNQTHGGLGKLFADEARAAGMLKMAEEVAKRFGASIRAGGALSPTDIPLPTIYVPVIVELVWAYGQARKYATVYPLGAGTVKLPRLKAGEDTFAYIGIGTAGMSQNVPQKEVTAELITFTANKLGGLIRIPTELQDDTFIPLGQFLARYIARQFAKLEDATLFIGDGTATYANITGVGPYCVANNTYLVQLAGGKTKPSDAVLQDFRNLRSKVNPAVLVGISQTSEPMACYYLHPTMEALLVTFNTLGAPLVYRPAIAGQPPTLDGFPIRWIASSQAYSTLAAASSYLAFFGDLSYWYLGERGAPRVEVSRDVFFATDELAMRALERIDVEAMAIDAMATLQTAAA
jgi:HK97 family phage major capsid protein